MAGKNVTSSNPQKKEIVAALKALSRGTKVTLVKEVSPGVFEGHCLESGSRKRSFHSLGVFRVQEVKNAAGEVTHYVSATDIVTVPPMYEIALGISQVTREQAKFLGEHIEFVSVGEEG